jgi:demethylmenaquinone methyltransferase/2-methoxy-6-polyprenyl-1,4-benzoquinol methylase
MAGSQFRIRSFGNTEAPESISGRRNGKGIDPARRPRRLTKAELAHLYDTTAWYWESLPHRISYGYAYFQLFKRLESDGWLRDLKHARTVLDCGIGAGLLSDALLRTVRHRPEVCGVDLSRKLLARAQKRLRDLGASVRTFSGDVHSLPFAGGGMDLVISALMLEHVAEPLKALREMTRVARKGATLVLVATRPGAPSHLFRMTYRYKPWPAEQLIAWMKEAGIEDIRTYPLAGIARLFGQAYIGRAPR